MIPLGEVVHFDVTTRGASGVSDADSAPTFSVFEEATDTPIIADTAMTKRTSLTGNYRGTFTASSGNGFEVGKWYNAIATGVVGGVTDKTVALTFRVCAAENSEGTPVADTVRVGGTTQTARDLGASVLLSSGTGTGQLDFTSGVVKANAVQLLGTAWLTPGTAGTPDVNVKLWNALTTVALPLTPTVAGRTLDVSAGGEAGVDWANVGSPTTTVDLSGTTIAITQRVDVNTIKTQTVTCAAGVTVYSHVGTAAASTAQTGDNYARLGAPAGVSVSADVAALPAALLDLTDGIETGLTPRQAMRAYAAALAGVLSGAGTTTITIKGAGVATTRITATVDADGNRSVVVLNL